MQPLETKTTKNKFFSSTAAIVMALSTTVVQAQTTQTTVSSATAAPTGTSVTSAQVVAPKPSKSPIGVRTASIFYGPSLDRFETGASVSDPKGGQEALHASHAIGLQVRATDQLTIVPTLYFDTILKTIGNTSAQRFSWLDSYINVNYGSLASYDFGNDYKFNLFGQFRYVLPTSKGSSDAKSLGSMRTFFVPSIQLGNSGFSVEAPAYARYYLQTRDNSPSGGPLNRWRFYQGTQLNYQISSNWKAFVLYEHLITRNNRGVSDLKNGDVLSTDINPGVEFSSGMLTVTPSVTWYPKLPISTTSVALEVDLAI